MTLFLEQQFPILILGMFGVIASLFALLRTGLIRFLYVAVGVVLLTITISLIERMVITPREEVEQTLQNIARDLESNQPDLVLRHVAHTSLEVQSDARRNLQRIEFHRVAIKQNLQITISPETPNQARAAFNVVVVASERRGSLRHQTSPWYFVVDFVRQGDHWKVVGYQRYPPHQQMAHDSKLR